MSGKNNSRSHQKTNTGRQMFEPGMWFASANVLLSLMPWGAVLLVAMGVLPASEGSAILLGVFFVFFPVASAVLGSFLLLSICGTGKAWGQRITAASGILISVVTLAAFVILSIVGERNRIHVPDRSESSAIDTLHAISVAQQAFHNAHGQYASSFDELTSATPPFLNGNWRDPKSGYEFILSGDGSHFRLKARPVNPAKPGARRFYMDETDVIRSGGGDARATSPPI